MRKFLGIILLVAICFFVCGQKVKASDPLQDCLDEVDAEYDIEMDYCNLMWPGSWACLNAAVNRSIEGAVQCHLKYDTIQ